MNVALQQNSRTSSQRGRLFLLLGKRGGLKTSKGATIAKEFSSSSIKTSSSRKDLRRLHPTSHLCSVGTQAPLWLFAVAVSDLFLGHISCWNPKIVVMDNWTIG